MPLGNVLLQSHITASSNGEPRGSINWLEHLTDSETRYRAPFSASNAVRTPACWAPVAFLS